MAFQKNEIINFLIDYQFIVIPALGGFAAFIAIITWYQVRQGWRFYSSKRRLIEQLQGEYFEF